MRARAASSISARSAVVELLERRAHRCRQARDDVTVVVPAPEAELDRNLLDLDVREAGAPDELLDPLRLAERELAGVAGNGRFHQPTLDQGRPVGRRPRVAIRGRPGGERERASGTEHAAGLAERQRGIRDEHVPEPRDDSVDARVREVDRLHVHRAMLGVRDPALPRSLDHHGREVGRDDVGNAAGQRFDEVAGAAREVEHDVVRLRVERGDERRRHGCVHLRDRLALGLPAHRGGVPALPELVIHCALYPHPLDHRLLPVRTQEIVVLAVRCILLILSLGDREERQVVTPRLPRRRPLDQPESLGDAATCAGTSTEPSCRCRSRSARSAR